MTQPTPMVEIWRGDIVESLHLGHAVVCDAAGNIIEAWGDPDKIILPRSSCKMLQALPLIESGAAREFDLNSEHLALACASHQGAAIHTDRVALWLKDLGLSDDDFRCGPQAPSDKEAKHDLIRRGETPCQMHNNCSGKHAGFLTLSKHLSGGPDYVALDHPVQIACRTAFEEMTGMEAPGYGIDGCSAPNFATSVKALAHAMAKMAAPTGSGARAEASRSLVDAMIKHPELVAGETRACTELMRAANGQAAIKIGAEAVYVAILPGKGLGIAVKIIDGATRAAECVIAALMVKYGVLDAAHPAAIKRLSGPITNWRGIVTGEMRLAPEFTTL